MSKFKYSAMSLSALTSNDPTYFREPISPSSSAPQKPNRTALWISGELPNCSAVSRTAATPDPLSLMPGPSGTLSRCAPAITTSVVDPVLVCAMTLRALKLWTLALSLMVVGPGCTRSCAPMDLVTLTTGIFTSVSDPRVPPICCSSALSATIIATAPRWAAASSFWANGQVPRSTSTTAPCTGGPSKSEALQPGLSPVGAATSGPLTPSGGVLIVKSIACASTVLPPTVTVGVSACDTRAENSGVWTSKPLLRNVFTT